MGIQKNPIILNLVIFFIVMGIVSSLTFGAECGCFDSNCPDATPPCYKVVFSGINDCPWDLCDGADGVYIVKHINDCIWREAIEPSRYDVELEFNEYAETSLMLTSDEPLGTMCFAGWEDENCLTVGFTENFYEDCSSSHGYGGTVTWEPIWDCSACDNCDDLTTNVAVSPNETIYYSNLACCPVTRGETGYITLSCDDADFVVPSAPTYSGNSSLVNVIYDPNCQEAGSITYTIQTVPTDPRPLAEKEVTVTCEAAFFTEYGETNSASGSITVKPKCNKCCDKRSGCPAAGL